MVRPVRRDGRKGEAANDCRSKPPGTTEIVGRDDREWSPSSWNSKFFNVIAVNNRCGATVAARSEPGFDPKERTRARFRSATGFELFMSFLIVLQYL